VQAAAQATAQAAARAAAREEAQVVAGPMIREAQGEGHLEEAMENDHQREQMPTGSQGPGLPPLVTGGTR